MTALEEEIRATTPAQSIDYVTTVEDFNLEYYTRQLVTEARKDSYSLRTRNAFLVAVGAVALREYEEFPIHYRQPPFANTAYNAVSSYNALDVVASVDEDMPYWQTNREWKQGVRSAFKSVRPQHKSFTRPEFTAVGCTVLLEHLQNRRAYIRLPQNSRPV